MGEFIVDINILFSNNKVSNIEQNNYLLNLHVVGMKQNIIFKFLNLI